MTDTTITPAPPETQTRAAINTEIRSIARIAGLDQSWIDGQIDAAADADTARRAAFDVLPNSLMAEREKRCHSPPDAQRCRPPPS